MSTSKSLDRSVLLTAAEAATWAPSVHNSQPWRFEVGDGYLDVFADKARWLHGIDHTGREMTISCGAAIYFAYLGLRGQSAAVDVDLLPDPLDLAHLARLTTIGIAEPTAEERDLVRAIPIRYTDRGLYDDEPLPAELVEAMRRGVNEYGGAWLRPIETADDAIATAVLLAHADDAEQADPAYLDELNRWSRYDAGAKDGIPRQAVSDIPVADRASMYRLRDFDVDGRAMTSSPGAGEPPAAERPFVCILGTPGDNRQSWLDAGMALGWLLLRAAAAGVVAQPMTQPLEVAAVRARLTHSLGLLGHPQMLLRMGHGTGQPTTHRRSVESVADVS